MTSSTFLKYAVARFVESVMSRSEKYVASTAVVFCLCADLHSWWGVLFQEEPCRKVSRRTFQALGAIQGVTADEDTRIGNYVQKAEDCLAAQLGWFPCHVSHTIGLRLFRSCTKLRSISMTPVNLIYSISNSAMLMHA